MDTESVGECWSEKGSCGKWSLCHLPLSSPPSLPHCTHTVREVNLNRSNTRSLQRQAIKDVLQELVDDNLICLEKIGAANYYWGFLSEINTQSLARKQRLDEADASATAETAELEEKVAVAREKRQRPDRSQVLSELSSLSKEKSEFSGLLFFIV